MVVLVAHAGHAPPLTTPSSGHAPPHRPHPLLATPLLWPHPSQTTPSSAHAPLATPFLLWFMRCSLFPYALDLKSRTMI